MEREIEQLASVFMNRMFGVQEDHGVMDYTDGIELFKAAYEMGRKDNQLK